MTLTKNPIDKYPTTKDDKKPTIRGQNAIDLVNNR